MELICPSCEARYQVPDSHVGEKGRQVSCMNCGHSWHAFPPLVLGSTAAPPTTASPGIDYQSPSRPSKGRSTASGAAPVPEKAPPRPTPRTESFGQVEVETEAPRAGRETDPSRSEQLAEIRQMLAEVQSEERAAAAMSPEEEDGHTRIPGGSAPLTPGREPDAAAGGTRREAPQDREAGESGDSLDALRRRLAQDQKPDVGKLRRKHDRKAREHKRAQETGSGAFLSGFLLIVMIGATMAALYVLHPQIIARMPGIEPAMQQYVDTIDGLRAVVADGLDAARDWVMDVFVKAT